jgi:uncharacterized membrane protein YdjX (TVP38/TMEM64 family)
MASEVHVIKRKPPIVKMAIAAIVLAVVGVMILRGVDLRAVVTEVMALIRSAGALVFFSAMTVLPAMGMPLFAFTITAGEAFGGQFGMPGVIAMSLSAIAVNLAVGYSLARFAVRPVLLGLLKRYGYSIPHVTPENALLVTLVVRLTPGPPYSLQGYILGVARAPFRLYMIVSWLAVAPWAVAGIVLGEGLFNGNFRMVGLAVGLILAVGVGVQLVRRKYLRREY